jgi:hypothetical protein
MTVSARQNRQAKIDRNFRWWKRIATITALMVVFPAVAASGLLLIAATPFVPKTDKDASWLALLGLAASLFAFALVVAWLITVLIRALYRCVTPFNSLMIYYISVAREILEDWARAADGSHSKKSTWIYHLSVRRVEGELTRPGPGRRRFATRSAREWERQQRIRVALEVAFADVRLRALPQASVTHAQWILDRVYLQALWNDWSTPLAGVDLPPQPGKGYRSGRQVAWPVVKGLAAFGATAAGLALQVTALGT